MKTVLAVLALLLLAAPAHAQLLERGVARSGEVQQTITGGNAFMCRLSCSLNGGCAGWSWTRPGADGPEAQCRLLAGAVEAKPDACCDSGLSTGQSAPVAAIESSSRFRGNQYAGRSAQQPAGPPVELVNIPGGMWEDEEAEDEDGEAQDGETGSELAAAANDQDGAAPARATPTGRITATRSSAGLPRYSVQKEYSGAAPQPEQPVQGIDDPSRWLGG